MAKITVQVGTVEVEAALDQFTDADLLAEVAKRLKELQESLESSRADPNDSAAAEVDALPNVLLDLQEYSTTKGFSLADLLELEQFCAAKGWIVA